MQHDDSTLSMREGLIRHDALRAELKQVRANIAILKSKWMEAGIEQASVEGMLKQLERESPLKTEDAVPTNRVWHLIFARWYRCD
jgi:hypothetical protein